MEILPDIGVNRVRCAGGIVVIADGNDEIRLPAMDKGGHVRFGRIIHAEIADDGKTYRVAAASGWESPSVIGVKVGAVVLVGRDVHGRVAQWLPSAKWALGKESARRKPTVKRPDPRDKKQCVSYHLPLAASLLKFRDVFDMPVPYPPAHRGGVPAPGIRRRHHNRSKDRNACRA